MRRGTPLTHEAKENELLRGLIVSWAEEQGNVSYLEMASRFDRIISDAYFCKLLQGEKRGFGLVTACRVLEKLGITLTEFERMLKEIP